MFAVTVPRESQQRLQRAAEAKREVREEQKTSLKRRMREEKRKW